MNIPRATYRIQFTPSFGFSQAKEIVSYLADLGVSHLYASPIFKAHKGSAHGYDIVDPGQLNPELGAAEVFRELVEELKGRGILWLQDIVPNHVAFDSDNEMLMDVLENGRDSAYFHFFDIDWNHPYENLRGRLLAPFLGKFYAEALEDGEIRLEYDEKGMTINYYQLRMPLKVQSYVEVLESRITHLEEKLTGTNPDFTNLLGIIHLFKTLASPQGNIQQSEQVGHAKKMLWLLYSENAAIRQFIDENILLFNGERGKPESFDILDKLISSQLFRLSFWKVASEEINYRRFFTINELISVRVEDKFVFNHTHRLIFQLVREGVFDGLRVDHIDGLYDPTSYLKHLRKRAGDIYIVAEKILASSERLPVSWPIQGSTGYDFMNYVNRIFCKGESQKAFFKLYRSFTGMTAAYEDLVCEKKRTIISKHLAGNIDNLAHLLKKISSHDKYGRDITLYGLRRALVEVMAMCGVYRTYVNQEGATAEDMQYLAQAIQRTHQRLPGFFYEVNFIEKFLLLRYNGHVSEELKKQWIDFVMNFQQYTAPLMAKGFEDTVLYVFAPLLSLNEVGGDPTQFGCTLEEFHDFIAQGPGMRTALNATATHDTKRGEDVRARINVLSEFSQEWEQHLKAWAKLNKKK
ncbi:MAG: malto-oligosyltrehalose synthase, partial [Candidatus Omnitrophica bacterium]|nr:malto-oligosyltrehalose synthase [Candidatus Omnitrophota bacterium]